MVMMDLFKQAFLTIGATNFTEVVDFYQNLLQQKPQPYSPERYAEFQLPGMVLGIFSPQPSHAGEFSQSQNSGFSLCLEVEDLEMAIARMTKLDPSFDRESMVIASHGREIYGYDPAGNRLIFHSAKS